MEDGDNNEYYDNNDAQSISALETQIVALQAQIAQLQALISASQGQVQGAFTSCYFSRDLGLGATGEDVRALQRFLNRGPQTQVASYSAGAPGLETSYYGYLTQSAIRRFQALRGISASGYFDSQTRTLANQLCNN